MLTVPHGAMLAAAAVGAPALAGALLAGALLDVQAPRMIPNVATTAARRRGPCRTRVMSPPLGPAARGGRQSLGPLDEPAPTHPSARPHAASRMGLFVLSPTPSRPTIPRTGRRAPA